MRDFKLFLNDILKASLAIRDFIKGMDYVQFYNDDKTVSAVIKKLEIIGEAAKNIPDEIISANPDIPWREMAGIRDILVHAYFGTDYEVVWRTAAISIPEIIPQIEKIIKGL